MRALARPVLLVDLDDTLYDYPPADAAGRKALFHVIATELALPEAEVEAAWKAARDRVKKRLGTRASAHSRLLYLMDLAHALGPARAVREVRRWEKVFWTAYLRDVSLRPGALPLLRAFKARGGKVAIVTDLTLAPQLDKLTTFSLFDEVDAVVVSEEVPNDKPAREIFELALARLGASGEECVVVGDNEEKDGAGALAIGATFHLVATSESARGCTLEEITKEICA